MQILTAQKLGAKAVVIAQNRIEQAPVRVKMSLVPDSTAGVKIPVVMISFEVRARCRVFRCCSLAHSSFLAVVYGVFRMARR